ncbi:MAG: hypothetical protein ABIL05_01665 [candidate division WOR-3 bacterium]
MDNKELRRNILEILYKKFCDHPYNSVTPKEFIEDLKVSRSELNFNIVYLESKGLVELHKPLEGDIFVAARITSKGIDLIEDDIAFNATFPRSAPRSEPDLTHIIQRLKDLNNKMADTEFNQVESDVKELIKEAINALIEEMGKPEISYKKLKQLFEQIKNLNKAIGESIRTILTDPAVINLIACSARRDLLDL